MGNGHDERRFRPALLLFNHMDAWVTAGVVTAVALLVQGKVMWPYVGLVVVMGVGYGVAFAINDFYDAPADALDERKRAGNFFVWYPVSGGWLVAGVVLVCAPLLFVFVQFGWRSWLVMGVCLVVMWGYSAPPLRFKERPGVDLLVHALFVETFPYAVVVFLAGGVWGVLDVFLLVLAFLASLTAQIEQQVRDYEVDRAAGGRSFALYVGRDTAVCWLRVGTVLLVGVGLVGAFSGVVPVVLVPLGLIALPALLHRLVRGAAVPRSEGLVFGLVVLGLLYVLGLFGYLYGVDGLGGVGVLAK